MDITNRTFPVNDPLYAKTLVLCSDNPTAVIITVDTVAIGEIGRIRNDSPSKGVLAISEETPHPAIAMRAIATVSCSQR